MLSWWIHFVQFKHRSLCNEWLAFWTLTSYDQCVWKLCIAQSLLWATLRQRHQWTCFDSRGTRVLRCKACIRRKLFASQSLRLDLTWWVTVVRKHQKPAFSNSLSNNCDGQFHSKMVTISSNIRNTYAGYGNSTTDSRVGGKTHKQKRRLRNKIMNIMNYGHAACSECHVQDAQQATSVHEHAHAWAFRPQSFACFLVNEGPESFQNHRSSSTTMPFHTLQTSIKSASKSQTDQNHTIQYNTLRLPGVVRVHGQKFLGGVRVESTGLHGTETEWNSIQNHTHSIRRLS